MSAANMFPVGQPIPESITLHVPLEKVSRTVRGVDVEMMRLAVPLGFARKARSLDDMECGNPQTVYVYKSFVLTAEEFDAIAGDFFRRVPFLEGHAVAPPEPNALACVMLSAPERPYLFIDTAGYEYPRYVARLG